MLKYVARKLLLAIPLILGVVTLIFVLLELSPGDISSKYFTPETPPEVRALIVQKYDLDKPAITRYLTMVRNLAFFDFGQSMNEDRPVFEVISQSLPNTLLLSFTTLLVLFPVGIAVGTIQAVWQNTPIDAGASVSSLAVYSMPGFWVAMMLQLLLGIYWSDWLADLGRAGWLSPGMVDMLTLPTLGMKDAVMYDFMSPWEQLVDRAKHLVLPGLAVGLAAAASTARYMRASLLGIIRQDFIRTARAKGLTERAVVIKHGVRNALLPIVTLMGLSIPFLFSGSIIVELVFGWPGMGRVIYTSILTQDTPLLIACFYVYTLVVVLGNLMADITYAYVDPTIVLE
ncbi:MAG: ABC transporter permease [Myxococcales bacterium]|nr:ABC transporter permease [Myxococcales bacterium]